MSIKKKIASLALAAAFITTTFTAGDAATREEIAAINVKANGSNFKYWTKNSAALKQLKDYMADITNKNSRNYIPKDKRVAVFDMDGTILCETAPIYFDHMVFLHRVLEDKNFTPTQEEYQTAKNIEAQINKVGVPYPSTNNARVNANSFRGMTREEFVKYNKDYMNANVKGLTNLKWGEAFYLPMMEIISFLNNNDFKVYIVSGTEREMVRVLLDGLQNLPPNQMIGSDIIHKADNQGDTASEKYTFKRNDNIVRGEFLIKNLNMNKTNAIIKEIGIQPVLAFGNSMSDASMMNYAITNNKYKALAFGVICDDRERELGSKKTEEAMLKGCAEYGWTPISMKNDFKTIYGDNVKVQK